MRSTNSHSRTWILAATILGSSMAFIDGTVVNVAITTLQATFHASVVDVQWVVEIPRARLLYFWPRAQSTCTYSSEVLALLTQCRNTSFVESNKPLTSAC